MRVVNTEQINEVSRLSDCETHDSTGARSSLHTAQGPSRGSATVLLLNYFRTFLPKTIWQPGCGGRNAKSKGDSPGTNSSLPILGSWVKQLLRVKQLYAWTLSLSAQSYLHKFKELSKDDRLVIILKVKWEMCFLVPCPPNRCSISSADPAGSESTEPRYIFIPFQITANNVFLVNAN